MCIILNYVNNIQVTKIQLRFNDKNILKSLVFNIYTENYI